MDNHPINRDFHGRNDEELSLLYQLGIALASGKDLFSTLLTLQTTILKLIQADAMFVAIYNEATDIVEYPIYFEVGQPGRQPARRLSERPGLTGAVLYKGKTLYLPEMNTAEITNTYAPVDDDHDDELHTFLGIPLIVNYKVIGVLSVQSTLVDAYSIDQIQLMENIAIQAALTIDKSRLLDQLKRELEERTRIETNLRQRESILEAVTFAAEQFLKTSDWRLTINDVLERLGITMQVTHAYLFEDHTGRGGEEVTSMRYEWAAPRYSSDLDNPCFQDSKINMRGYAEQVDALHRGDVRTGNSSSFNPIEKQAMDELGIKAILEVPIFVNNQEWGAIGFDDFEQERQWTSAEIDALKIAAGILGAAIQRQKADAAVQESDRIYRQAIEAADAVPYYYDYTSNSYLFIGAGIRTMTGYGSEEMTPALWSKIIEETITLGFTKQIGQPEGSEAKQNKNNQAWKRDQKIRTRGGQIRWLADRSIQLLNEHNIAYGSVGILQDITDRKLTEANLRKREALLEAITFSAEQFLKASDWRENINVVLERLGKEFNVSHAYLFEHRNAGGKIFSSMQYEWTAPGFSSNLEDAAFQNAHVLSEDRESTHDILRRGIVFIGNSSTFPEVESERLTRIGIKGMIEVPLFIKGEWWGTIGLDDMSVEREWSPAEVDALKIAAGILIAAIQRQEAESAVQESERIYRQAIEAAGAVPYFRNHDLPKYIFMGKGIREMTGYPPEELTPPLWNQLVLEAETAGELAGLTENEAVQIMRSGKAKAWRCDYLIQTRSGQRRWVADSAIEMFNDTGRCYGSVGIMQDITERKLVESNLRKGEAILEVVAEAANTFLKIANWNAEVWQTEVDKLLKELGTAINASHAYLFENDLVDNQTLMTMCNEWTAPGFQSDLGNPKYIKKVAMNDPLKNWETTVRQGFPFIGDASHLDSADMDELHRHHIHALVDVPIMIDGRWWGTIGFDDMDHPRTWSTTEVDALVVASNLLVAAIQRNQMDSMLQKELEQRKILINELESKNEELERFTYTVSHDLKSPLVTISGFLGYLEQDAIHGNIKRFRQDAQRIQEAVVKMQRLLSELLELSRIGRIMNAPQELSFNDLLEETLDIVHGRLEGRNIAVYIQPNLAPVYGDKPRLLEVLQNLLDNAAKYMGDQPNPRIEIGQRGEEDGVPVFFIKDNGIGIAPEYHERIFGLFNKLDVQTEGTGVGLALVKRIIEVHDGRIWVESELGKGSTFYFTLRAQPRPDSVI